MYVPVLIGNWRVALANLIDNWRGAEGNGFRGLWGRLTGRGRTNGSPPSNEPTDNSPSQTPAVSDSPAGSGSSRAALQSIPVGQRITPLVIKLIAAQDEVMNDPNLMQGGRGPDNVDHGPNATWCNQATLSLAKKMGVDTTNILEPEGRPKFTKVNQIGSGLAAIQAQPPFYRSWRAISGERAQKKANEGTLVIAAWVSPSGDKSGHVATVRPGNPYTEKEGPEVANVGSENAFKPDRDAFAVDLRNRGASSMDEIHYYYDPNQGRPNQGSKV